MGLFDAIGSIISSAITNEVNGRYNRMAYNRQEDLLHEQMDFDREMWNKANEYNSPTAELERLKAAGINPSQIAAQHGVVKSSPAQAVTAPAATSVSPIPFVDMFSSLAQSLSSIAAGRLAGSKAQTEDELRSARKENVLRQNELLKEQTSGLELTNKAQQIENEYLNARYTWSIKQQEAEYSYTWSQKRSLDAGTKKLYYELRELLPEEKRKLRSETSYNILNLDRLAADILNVKADTQKKNAETGLLEAERETESHKQENLDVNSAYTAEQYAYYSAQISKMFELYDAQISEMAAKTDLTKEQVQWYLFEALSKNDIGIGPFKFNPTFTSGFKAGRGIDKEFRQRYGN